MWVWSSDTLFSMKLEIGDHLCIDYNKSQWQCINMRKVQWWNTAENGHLKNGRRERSDIQGLAREEEEKQEAFVVMEGSEKLYFQKEDMVNNQYPLDFIISKSLITWGSICSIQCMGSLGRTWWQCDDEECACKVSLFGWHLRILGVIARSEWKCYPRMEWENGSAISILLVLHMLYYFIWLG